MNYFPIFFVSWTRTRFNIRTYKDGISTCKASGKKLGRPKGVGKSKLDGKEKEIQHFLDKGVTKANIAKNLDVSWGKLENFIKRKMNKTIKWKVVIN